MKINYKIIENPWPKNTAMWWSLRIKNKEIREKFQKNHIKFYNGSPNLETKYGFLGLAISSFNWMSSPEGDLFWRKLYDLRDKLDI